MKSLLFSVMFLLLNFQSQATAPKHPSLLTKNYPVLATLKSGTSVTLETAESLSSSKATQGKLVQFRVKMNVVVNGHTVIQTGAMAIGRVKSIEKTTFNSPEKITLELVECQAVDGQMVALMGLPQEFEAEWPNEPVSVGAGQMFQATVMNNMEILTQQ